MSWLAGLRTAAGGPEACVFGRVSPGLPAAQATGPSATVLADRRPSKQTRIDAGARAGLNIRPASIYTQNQTHDVAAHIVRDPAAREENARQ